MALNKHCLRIENDLEGYQQLRWMVKMRGLATLMYDVRTRRLLVLEGDQDASCGSIVRLFRCVPVDLSSLTLQTIYDQLAEVLERRWELGWVNG